MTLILHWTALTLKSQIKIASKNKSGGTARPAQPREGPGRGGQFQGQSIGWSVPSKAGPGDKGRGEPS